MYQSNTDVTFYNMVWVNFFNLIKDFPAPNSADSDSKIIDIENLLYNCPNLLTDLHEGEGKCAVDLAAHIANLPALQWLVELKHASIRKTDFSKSPSILYWACVFEEDADEDEARAVMDWLALPDNLALLQAEGIQLSHIQAAKGELPTANSNLSARDAWGLYPYHYAALRGDDFKQWIPEERASDYYSHKFTQGFFAGTDLLWLLTNVEQSPPYQRALNLIKVLSDQGITVNLNAHPTLDGHPKRGKSTAYNLMSKEHFDSGDYEQFDLLANQPLNIEIDYNLAFIQPGSESNNESVAWVAARYGHFWLLERAADKGIPVDLNMKDEGDGINVAWILASHRRQDETDQNEVAYRVLTKLIATNKAPIDLEVKHLSPSEDEDKDVTLAALLVEQKQWGVLQELLSRTETFSIDLKLAPDNKMLSTLVSEGQLEILRQILNKNAENAAPANKKRPREEEADKKQRRISEFFQINPAAKRRKLDNIAATGTQQTPKNTK